jgi:glucose/arabinose dehydrogenase
LLTFSICFCLFLSAVPLFSPSPPFFWKIQQPCNYCYNSSYPADPEPAIDLKAPLGTITELNLDGSDWKPVCDGVRNSVGLGFSPVTGNMWFTDNGRDNMDNSNYDKPWDELNTITKPNENFGFPFCYGYGTNLTTGGPDPIFNNGTCAGYTGAALELGPHVAPLGLSFLSDKMFPSKLNNQIVIAEHGSWNRPPGELTGYQVVLVFLDQTGTKAEAQQPLVSGWLEANGATRWGRPVDVFPIDDGSLLVSDDFGNSIFRITYEAPQ